MRLIILTSSRIGLACDCLKVLVGRNNLDLVRVVFSHAISANPAKLRRRKLEKVRQIGVLGALNGMRIRGWYRSPAGDDLKALCKTYNVPYFETCHTNSTDTERLFCDAAADLGISLGNSYILPRVFGIPQFGMINFHGEILPKYQNAQSVIWPIYNMETETGLTIHKLDHGIDTGPILYREIYPIDFKLRLRDTVTTTNENTRKRAPGALLHVCMNYPALLKAARPQSLGAKYTTPSFQQFLRIVQNNRILYRRAQFGGYQSA